MAKTKFKKKIKNGIEYYFFRLSHTNLRKPKDIYAKTTKELTEKIKKITNELDHNIIDIKTTFGDFFSMWLFDVNFLNKKPSTKERYEGLYRNYIKPNAITSIKLLDLNQIDIQQFYNNLLKKEISVATIKQLNKIIAPSIRYAYNNDLILKDFTGAIILPTESEKDKLKKESQMRVFTLAEQQKFEKLLVDHRLGFLFKVALYTGMRQGELLALKWTDIDFSNNEIHINKSYKVTSDVSKEGRSNCIGLTQTPKTKNSVRIIPIPSLLIPLFKINKKFQKANKLKLANFYVENNLVFCNCYGKHLDPSGIRKDLKKLLKENDLPYIKFHDLRHTYATRLFENNVEAKTVQMLLGHSNISTTLDRYTHVLPNTKHKAVESLNNIYFIL